MSRGILRVSWKSGAVVAAGVALMCSAYVVAENGGYGAGVTQTGTPAPRDTQAEDYLRATTWDDNDDLWGAWTGLTYARSDEDNGVPRIAVRADQKAARAKLEKYFETTRDFLAAMDKLTLDMQGAAYDKDVAAAVKDLGLHPTAEDMNRFRVYQGGHFFAPPGFSDTLEKAATGNWETGAHGSIPLLRRDAESLAAGMNKVDDAMAAFALCSERVRVRAIRSFKVSAQLGPQHQALMDESALTGHGVRTKEENKKYDAIGSANSHGSLELSFLTEDLAAESAHMIFLQGMVEDGLGAHHGQVFFPVAGPDDVPVTEALKRLYKHIDALEAGVVVPLEGDATPEIEMANRPMAAQYTAALKLLHETADRVIIRQAGTKTELGAIDKLMESLKKPKDVAADVADINALVREREADAIAEAPLRNSLNHSDKLDALDGQDWKDEETIKKKEEEIAGLFTEKLKLPDAPPRVVLIDLRGRIFYNHPRDLRYGGNVDEPVLDIGVGMGMSVRVRFADLEHEGGPTAPDEKTLELSCGGSTINVRLKRSGSEYDSEPFTMKSAKGDGGAPLDLPVAKDSMKWKSQGADQTGWDMDIPTKWEVKYYDAALGIVHGFATVTPTGTSVTLFDPRDGKKFELKSSAMEQVGDGHWRITLNGPSPHAGTLNIDTHVLDVDASYTPAINLVPAKGNGGNYGGGNGDSPYGATPNPANAAPAPPPKVDPDFVDVGKIPALDISGADAKVTFRVDDFKVTFKPAPRMTVPANQVVLDLWQAQNEVRTPSGVKNERWLQGHFRTVVDPFTWRDANGGDRVGTLMRSAHNQNICFQEGAEFWSIPSPAPQIQYIARGPAGDRQVEHLYAGIPSAVELVFDDPQDNDTTTVNVTWGEKSRVLKAFRQEEDHRIFISDTFIPSDPAIRGGGN